MNEMNSYDSLEYFREILGGKTANFDYVFDPVTGQESFTGNPRKPEIASRPQYSEEAEALLPNKDDYEVCPACEGYAMKMVCYGGMPIEKYCEECHGDGYIEKE